MSFKLCLHCCQTTGRTPSSIYINIYDIIRIIVQASEVIQSFIHCTVKLSALRKLFYTRNINIYGYKDIFRSISRGSRYGRARRRPDGFINLASRGIEVFSLLVTWSEMGKQKSNMASASGNGGKISWTKTLVFVPLFSYIQINQHLKDDRRKENR